MARLKYTFDALDPFGGDDQTLRTIGVEEEQLNHLLHNEHRVKFSRLLIAKEVVGDPVIVFEDWMRPEREEGLCYCGHPDHDFRGPQIETPPPPGMVFCVFVLPSGKITDWRWELAEPEEPDYPENWKERFGRIIWPRNQSIS